MSLIVKIILLELAPSLPLLSAAKTVLCPSKFQFNFAISHDCQKFIRYFNSTLIVEVEVSQHS